MDILFNQLCQMAQTVIKQGADFGSRALLRSEHPSSAALAEQRIVDVAHRGDFDIFRQLAGGHVDAVDHEAVQGGSGEKSNLGSRKHSDAEAAAHPLFLKTDARYAGESHFKSAPGAFEPTAPPADPPIFAATVGETSNDTSHGALGASGTGSATATATSHFTMVSEEDLDHFQPEEPASPYVSVKVAVLSATLLLVGLFFWYSLRSPTADHLYGTIESKIENTSDENDYLLALQSLKKEIGDFLSLYPNDFRAEKVRVYSGDLELGLLERRLERQLDRKNRDFSLSAIEYAYVEAIQTAKSDPERGIEKLEAFVDMFSFEKSPSAKNQDTSQEMPDSEAAEAADVEGAEAAEEESAETLSTAEDTKSTPAVNNEVGFNQTLPGQCVVLAKRRLEKIREECRLQEKQQTELLESRLELAETLAASDPERAATIRRAVVTFYAEKTWAAPVVEKARNALGE